MDDPLHNQSPLPIFSEIQPEQIEPALTALLNQNRAELDQLLSSTSSYTWDNLMQPMEELDDRLAKAWSPVAHLHAVMESDALRTAYHACLPLLTEYHTELLQNERLYRAVQSIEKGPDYPTLNAAQKKVIQNELRDFRLAGVSLPPADKMRFAELQKRLSQLSTQFAEHLLDATHAWTLHVTELDVLKGLPEQALQQAEQAAQQAGQSGWLMTLDYPCYSTAIKYLENRELRRLMYEAYTTRASDQGPHAGQWDNTAIMEEIVALRAELANILGFPDFAAYSLATKMAETPERVMSFLTDLVKQATPFAEKEMQALREVANSLDHIDPLEAWDLAFYTEKLRQSKYALSQEDLRPYFPIHTVLSGMFAVLNKILGITIVERRGVDVWHPHVQFFEVYDKQNQLRGYFYTDLYARPHKREGAWMDECRVRRRLTDGSLQYPVAFLTCNFSQPIGNKPALLTHDDVQTVFHEFGHCLHHLLTQVDYAAVSGINGVPWDAVEFPSQFFEFWCFEQEALKRVSAHETTGEPLPDALFKKLVAAKYFQSGMQMLRQLEFALFDFKLHWQFDPSKGPQVQSILNEVREQVAVVRPPQFNRFQHSFSHIFAGGYAAGYYSYKWAEVLSSDAYSKFEETGIFNEETGQSFLKTILEKGGVENPMALFIAFRGREPTIDALLRHSGLVAA